MDGHSPEQRLLSMVLDGLDDLYDQRFGPPAERRERDERAEVWMVRLLDATAAALQGTAWEPQLASVAAEIRTLLRNGESGERLADAALCAADDLRLAISSAL